MPPQKNRSKKNTSTPGKRQRNPVATRQAILDSARLAFTKYGYDGAGVRTIAENAGVTAMLVKHYFGSKEQLFEEVVEETLAMHGLLRAAWQNEEHNAEALGRDMARELMATSNSGITPDGTVILLRSVGNEQAARILREKAIRYLEPITGNAPGKTPEINAALCLALISGYKLMRQVIKLPALEKENTEELANILSKLFTILNEQKTSDAPD
ncbi:TetR/AcrR family transcriptional regulator [Maridesulfovibrio sp.]|uniref:TetR/AcrR family transcriptional regulator n=1 Tax=Maridesulfovibrio sp. TaxID=2795000 RepID=UPI002A18D422|nr:TetR/AcrR family transcriptional regulator [Maridesulfovibrio sp.]